MRSERGVALIVTLLMVLVLSTLVASALVITSTEVSTSSNYRSLVQARYLAEAGAQRAINWLTFSYPQPTDFSSFDMHGSPVTYGLSPVVLSAMAGVPGNYPTPAVQSAFQAALQGVAVPGLPGGSFSVTANLVKLQQSSQVYGGLPQTIQTWVITSQGTVGGPRRATLQVQLTAERAATVISGYALFATATTCGAVRISGGGTTDSFDSSIGPYAVSHTPSGGDVGTNGNVNLSGHIYGAVWSPNAGAGSCSSSNPNAATGAAYDDLRQLPGPQAFSPPPALSPAPPTFDQSLTTSCSTITGCTCTMPPATSPTSCGGSGPYTLAPGLYGNLILSGGKVAHLSAGTYNVNAMTLSGGSRLILDSYPVVINVQGTGKSQPVNFSGGALVNGSGLASNFTINYGGSGGVILSGGTDAVMYVYAPGAAVTISGGGDLFGSIIGYTINNSGGSDVHFDRALSGGPSGLQPFRLIGFNWSKF